MSANLAPGSLRPPALRKNPAAAARHGTERKLVIRPQATAGHEPEHDMAEAGAHQTDSDQAAWLPAQPAALAAIPVKGHGR